MALLGVIGGSGLYGLTEKGPAEAGPVSTPWGPTSGPVVVSEVGSGIAFVARHGTDHSIAPHRVNYRANVHALREAGCDRILAVSSVGGIAPACAPGVLVLPDQLIDYSWGREHTYCGRTEFPLQHVEFTMPFSAPLREQLSSAAHRAGISLRSVGTYGVTQGPRLETAAEIDRMERDGCDLVGMTAMPEAGLARELGISYAICCVVVNQAAGRSPSGVGIHTEIAAHLAAGLSQAEALVQAFLRAN